MSDLEVEAGALDGVGANLTVGDGDVFGMDGVTLEGCFRLEGAVEHHVGIRRGQTTVDVDFYVEESGHLAYETFQTFFNTSLDGFLLFFREFWIQCPENNVLNHNLKYIREFKMYSFACGGMIERDGLGLKTETCRGGMAIEFVADDGTAKAIGVSTVHP